MRYIAIVLLITSVDIYPAVARRARLTGVAVEQLSEEPSIRGWEASPVFIFPPTTDEAASSDLSQEGYLQDRKLPSDPQDRKNLFEGHVVGGIELPVEGCKKRDVLEVLRFQLLMDSMPLLRFDHFPIPERCVGGCPIDHDLDSFQQRVPLFQGLPLSLDYLETGLIFKDASFADDEIDQEFDQMTKLLESNKYESDKRDLLVPYVGVHQKVGAVIVYRRLFNRATNVYRCFFDATMGGDISIKRRVTDELNARVGDKNILLDWTPETLKALRVYGIYYDGTIFKM